MISDTTTVQGIQMSHLCQSASCIWQKIHPTGEDVCDMCAERGGEGEGEGEGERGRRRKSAR